MTKTDIEIMRESIDDAKSIVLEKRLMESQSAIIQIAIALFEHRMKK